MPRPARSLSPLLASIPCLLLLQGCYGLRGSAGGAEADFAPPRRLLVGDVGLPEGYRIEVVAAGLTYPTGVAFDADGRLHVVESGYCYGEVWTTPRLLRIEAPDRAVIVAEGGRNGPWTGACFLDGAFYVGEGGVLEGGRILRITTDGAVQPIVQGLPSRGDHHTNGPVAGPDGWIWFGQGTATNSGVVGEDNAKFGWLRRFPKFHDVPGQDIRLTGKTFNAPMDEDALLALSPTGQPTRSVDRTGAFAPFGESRAEAAGAVPCNGSVMRVRPDGAGLALVAWGFRNPFGLAFSPDGRLYATDNGYDERGSRPVWGAADLLFEVKPGVWYGWPDWSGDRPLTEEEFQPPGGERIEFLLADHPNVPPAPVALFGVHSSANGLDFSRSAAFGHEGDAFVALFGDETPATGKLLAPVGFKVVRVDVQTGLVQDFAVNRGDTNGPASWLESGGLERPVAARFDPQGRALYVVDFGVLTHDADGARPKAGTGVVWRITREG